MIDGADIVEAEHRWTRVSALCRAAEGLGVTAAAMVPATWTTPCRFTDITVAVPTATVLDIALEELREHVDWLTTRGFALEKVTGDRSNRIKTLLGLPA